MIYSRAPYLPPRDCDKYTRLMPMVDIHSLCIHLGIPIKYTY